MAANLEGAPLQQDNLLEEIPAVDSLVFILLLITAKRDGIAVEQTDLGFLGLVVWADKLKVDKTIANAAIPRYFNEEVFIFKKSFKYLSLLNVSF